MTANEKATNTDAAAKTTEDTCTMSPDGEHQWECESAIGPDSGSEYFTCTKCGLTHTIIYY